MILWSQFCVFAHSASTLYWCQHYVSVKSKLQHAPPGQPPGQPPGHLTFLKIIVQIPPYPGQNVVQMPHVWVHSGDQMPPPREHFTGTKMTERWWKSLQLSNLRIALFTNMRILKFRSQPTIAFFAAVNHLNGPLRKQNFTSRVEKVMVCDLWISIRFVWFSVSRFVACDRNYDWRQR